MKEKCIETPFIPQNPVSIAVVDGRISIEIEKNLLKLGVKIIKTVQCKELYQAVSYHPDMLMHPIDGKSIVVAPNIYMNMKNSFEHINVNIIKGSTVLMSNYPHNVAYNIGRIGRFAVHNFKYTDKLIQKLLEEKEVEFIHVKQGYSKCSICVVNNHAIITADRGIAKAVEKKGIEAMIISPGYIDLPELNYGFVGGISGLLGKNLLAFSGQLQHHPDYNRILKFLEKHKVEPIFLSSKISMDYGSIMPIIEIEE